MSEHSIPPAGDPFTANLDKRRNEWEAWQVVVSEFGARGIDMNDATNDSLVKAITVWGELLVDLRVDQPEHTRESARNAKITQYMRAKGS